MRHLSFLFFSFILSMCYNFISAQDTLWTLTGRSYEIENLQISSDSMMLKFTKPNGHDKKIYVEEVFSINYKEHGEFLYYIPERGDPNVEQMRSVVLGQNAAIEKNCLAYTLSGFLIGYSTPFAGLGFYSPAVPIAYSISVGSITVPTHKFIFNNNLQNKDGYFILGYSDGLKRKRTIHALLGGVVGTIAGITTILLIHK